MREVAEETGLSVEVVRWAGRVERDSPHGGVYVIDDYLSGLVGGTLRAADDAVDALWATLADLAGLPMAPGVVDALTAWRMLPA